MKPQRRWNSADGKVGEAKPKPSAAGKENPLERGCDDDVAAWGADTRSNPSPGRGIDGTGVHSAAR